MAASLQLRTLPELKRQVLIEAPITDLDRVEVSRYSRATARA